MRVEFTSQKMKPNWHCVFNTNQLAGYSGNLSVLLIGLFDQFAKSSFLTWTFLLNSIENTIQIQLHFLTDLVHFDPHLGINSALVNCQKFMSKVISAIPRNFEVLYNSTYLENFFKTLGVLKARIMYLIF